MTKVHLPELLPQLPEWFAERSGGPSRPAERLGRRASQARVIQWRHPALVRNASHTHAPNGWAVGICGATTRSAARAEVCACRLTLLCSVCVRPDEFGTVKCYIRAVTEYTQSKDRARGCMRSGHVRQVDESPSRADSTGCFTPHPPSARSPPTPEGRCAGRSRGAPRFLSRSAGVPMQGAPPLRCGVRRKGARGGGLDGLKTACCGPCGGFDGLTWFRTQSGGGVVRGERFRLRRLRGRRLRCADGLDRIHDTWRRGSGASSLA